MESRTVEDGYQAHPKNKETAQQRLVKYSYYSDVSANCRTHQVLGNVRELSLQHQCKGSGMSLQPGEVRQFFIPI